MGKAAADRAAIADLVMRNVRNRGLEQRMRRIEPFVVFDVAPTHHGAQRDAFRRNPDAAQIGELAKVDQQGRLGKAEREHRDEALAAGDRLGVTVTRRQELNGFGERRRACIVEGRQFHDSVASFGTQRCERYLSSQPRMGQRDRAAAANPVMPPALMV